MTYTADSKERATNSDPRPEVVTSRQQPTLSDVLCHVPRVDAHIGPDSRLVMWSDPRSMEADRIRTLRVYLRAISRARRLKVLMVTSALGGEGKSVASLNLAVGLAQRGEGVVILVESDLRRPTLTDRLGIPASPALVDCIEKGGDPILSLRRVNELGIYVLPAGVALGNPIEYLNSDRFAHLIQRLRSVADWVILDCPPLIPVADALAVRGNVDGCLWVIKADKTSRETVQEAMQKIGQEIILGVILNEDQSKETSQSAPYYNYDPLRMLEAGS